MQISKFTLIFGIYIIISSLFMQQAWDVLRAIFGQYFLNLFLILLGLVATSAVIRKGIKSGLGLIRMVLICAVCLWGFVFTWRQPYFSEKAHVLEFGLLGWLATRDLTLRNNRLSKAAFLAFVFAATIGILEEGFQKLLPWRICEIRDMVTDGLSGMLGIILFMLSQTGLSSFIRPF